MARFIKDRKESKGKAPGSLVLIGRQKMESPTISLMKYNSDNYSELENISLQDAVSSIDNEHVCWINILGIHDMDLISEIGKAFNIHSLLLEDILNTDHRPKYEEGENYYAFIMKMLEYNKVERSITAEQITLVLGKNYVLSFQEREGDVFNHVRDRIRQKKGKVRLNHTDYLTYALLDALVDSYMLIIESLGMQIEDLEDEVLHNPSDSIVQKIYEHKTELNFLRKSIRPVRDFMIFVLKSEEVFLKKEYVHFLNDLNDHIIQVSDTIELYNSLVSDQLDAYNSSVSNRMNEVMKVLTIFAAIFIPLTFMAGIYGMNFEYLPELKFKYAYLIFWIFVLIIGFGLLYYFKKKRWL